jgi:hypothetical protein
MAAIDGVPEPELALGVIAPALDPAALEEHACPGVSGLDVVGEQARAEVDRRQRVAHLAGVVTDVDT